MTDYQLKIKQLHINYVDYYEKVNPIKRYSIDELDRMSEMDLLQIMPQNQSYDVYSESSGYYTTKYITTFKISKTIDSKWNIGYYEGHQNKTIKDQFKLFELTYISNLKNGLIDLFLMVQKRNIDYFESIKNGDIKIMLGDSWDNRLNLGLL